MRRTKISIACLEANNHFGIPEHLEEKIGLDEFQLMLRTTASIMRFLSMMGTLREHVEVVKARLSYGEESMLQPYVEILVDIFMRSTIEGEKWHCTSRMCVVKDNPSGYFSALLPHQITATLPRMCIQSVRDCMLHMHRTLGERQEKLRQLVPFAFSD